MKGFVQRRPRSGASLPAGLVALAAYGLLGMAAPQAKAQGQNLALTATATATSEFGGGGFDAARLNDGKETTRWNDDCAEPESELTLEWPQAVTIGNVVLKQAYDRIKTYTIDREGAAAGEWITVASGSGPGTGRIDINETLTSPVNPPATTKRLRIHITGKNSCASIFEIEVYAPEKINLALSATAEASSDYGESGFEGSRAIDGKDTTRWNDDCAEAAPTLTLTWAQPVTFNQVVTKFAYDRMKQYRLEALDASGNPTTIFTGTGPASGRIDINITSRATLATPVTANGLRYVTEDKVSCISIFELEVYNTRFGTITGKVVDEAGKPVEGATVAAGDVTATTDAAGAYTLVVDPGEVDLTVSKDPAYKSRTARGLEVGENGQVTRDLTLFPKPANLATGGTVDASSEDQAADEEGNLLYGADKFLDNDLNTEFRSTEAVDGYFGVNWDTQKTFNRVVIHEVGNVITGLTLQARDADGNYRDLLQRTFVGGSGDAILSLTLPQATTAHGIRAVVTGFAEQPGVNTVRIKEIEVQNAALGTLTGTVRSTAGAAIPNAAILTDTGTLAIADASGQFTVQVDADDYLLMAQAAGFFEGPDLVATVNVGETQAVTLLLPPKGDNFARTATAAASGEVPGDAGGEAASAHDGNMETYWEGDVYPADLTLTWAQPVTFNRVILSEFGDRSREISVRAFDAAKNEFVEVGSGVSPGGGQDVEIEHKIDLASAVTTTRLQISVPTGAGSGPRFREVEVYNFTPVTTPSRKPGDITNDGAVDLKDATAALQAAVGLRTLTAEELDAGDVVENNLVDIPDVTKILRVAVGLDTL